MNLFISKFIKANIQLLPLLFSISQGKILEKLSRKCDRTGRNFEPCNKNYLFCNLFL